MKLLIKRSSQDSRPSLQNKWSSQLQDFLWSLPFALIFSLSWSFVAVQNLELDFNWGANALLHLVLLLVGYSLSLLPYLSLGIFILLGGLVLVSFVSSFPALLALKQTLLQAFLAAKNAALWSFEATQAQASQPENYHVYIAFLACLLALIFLIKKPLPLVLAFFLLLPFFGAQGEQASNPTYVLALLAGLAALVFVFVREGKLQYKKQFSTNLPLILTSLLLLITFLVQALLPQDFFQNKELADRIRQLQKRMQAPEIVNYYEFSLRDAGYYPLNQNLGGPLQLNHELYMEVTGPAASLRLRGALAENYTGTAWLGQEMDPNYIFDNLSSHGTQAEVFSYPSVQGSARALFEKLYYQDKVTIMPLQLPVQVIFNGGRPQQINEADNPEQIYYYNQGGQIYASQEIVSPYEVQGWLPRELSNETKFSLLQQGIKEGQLSPVLQEKSQIYPELVEAYDPALYDILYSQEYQGHAALLGAFQALVKHLQENYSYSLDVAYPVPNEDFLANFLRDKEGYCTYFATALALLGRELGLETRYVEGFLVPGVDPDSYIGSREGGYMREVLSDSAHAWVEVNFHKLGWYPFDATPADVLQGFTNQEGEEEDSAEESETTQPSESEKASPPTSESTTAPQPTPPSSQPNLPEPPAQVDPPRPLAPWLKILLGLLALIFILALLFFFCLKRAKDYWRRRQDPQYLMDRISEQGQADLLRQIWEDIKHMYQVAGYSWQTNQTLQQKFAKLDQDLPVRGFNNYKVYLALEEAFFGEIDLPQEKLWEIFHYYQALELELKDQLKKGQWYRKRYLWPPRTARY
ncbi:MAG: transglutaminase-like domain-containing protein [Eubacteriales bacterium]|nr:transglutaminase-like domain-containing protein [Eubacteriales bacterium]